MMVFFNLRGILSLAVFISILLSTPCLSQQKSVTITSGPEGTSYDIVGREICEMLNSRFESVTFKELTSSGSLENIDNLGSRVSDLAIVQRDIFIDNIYDEQTGIKNLEIICPLFQEVLHIYVRGDKEVLSLNEFIEKVNSGQVIRVGVGSEKGFTVRLLRKIFNQYHLTDKVVFEFADSYNTHIAQIRNDEIQAIAIYSSPLEQLVEDGYSIVGFSKKQINEINIYQKNASIVKIDTDHFPELKKSSDLYTLGTWSLLVGLSESMTDLDRTNKKSLLNHLIAECTSGPTVNRSNFNFRYVLSHLKEVISEEEKQTPQFLEGLPLNNSLSENIGRDTFSIGVFQIILILIFSGIVIIFVSLIRRKRFLHYWLRYRHFFFSVCLVLIGYFTSVTILMNAERELYETYNIKSGLLDIPEADLHIWLITSTLTQQYNNLFPLSVVGKFVVSLLFYLNVVVVLGATAFEVFIRKLKTKKRQGKMKVKHENHLVICGWNSQSKQLISDAYDAIQRYHKSKDKIVCVVPDPKTIIEKNELVKKLSDLNFLSFVQGDAKMSQFWNNQIFIKQKRLFF